MGEHSSPSRHVSDRVGIEAVRVLLADLAVRRAAFTETELAVVADRRDPIPGLAARLVAKRAVLAALGSPTDPNGEWPPASALARVEVLTNDDGSPFIRLAGPLCEGRESLTLHVSMSHDAGLAAALVVLEPDAMTARQSVGETGSPGAE